MKFLEKDLEDIIFENLQEPILVKKLNNKGLDVSYPHYSARQLRIGNYGIADLVLCKRTLSQKFNHTLRNKGNRIFLPHIFDITVIELKKDLVDVSTLIQGARYIKGISQYLRYRKCDLNNYRFFLKLIGNKIDLGEWIYLFDYFGDSLNAYVEAYEYKMDLDGIVFQSKDLANYSLRDEGFE